MHACRHARNIRAKRIQFDREKLQSAPCGCAYYLNSCPDPSACPLRTMSLAEASDARKARLIALRKRKTGEVVDGYVTSYMVGLSFSGGPILSETNQ
jgi:hypothetical protein